MLIIIIILAILFFFFGWALIAIGAQADRDMEKAFNKKFYPNNTSEILELEICPVCKHENWIPKGTCSRCEVCFSKIGNCDE